MKNIKNRLKNIFKFYNNDINKVILLLKKGVYPYECMNEWKKFDSLPEKEEFYSNLNMADIADADSCMQKEFVNTLK